MNKGQLVDIFYLDFQKVIDKVCPQKILRKLSTHSVRQKTFAVL